jgi:DNA-binding transcriptional LysR family regulator
MRLDLRLLEVFCSVYEHKSFGKAAETLLLSQPTISGHIKNLEEALGVQLFDRLPRRIVPTQAARILYRHGQAIVSRREIALQELKGFLNRVEGSLAISASTIPGEYLLPQLLVSFHNEYPAVEVNLKISDSERVCREVAEGLGELGFVGMKLDIFGLEFRHFASDTLVLVVPNNQDWRGVRSISVADLKEKPFLARERGSGTRLAFETQMGCSLDDFRVVATLSSTNAVKEGLKSGLGVSVLSLLAVQTETEKGLLKTVKIEGLESLRRGFFIVVNRRLTLSPIAKLFLEFVESEAKQLGLIA